MNTIIPAVFTSEADAVKDLAPVAGMLALVDDRNITSVMFPQQDTFASVLAMNTNFVAQGLRYIESFAQTDRKVVNAPFSQKLKKGDYVCAFYVGDGENANFQIETTQKQNLLRALSRITGQAQVSRVLSGGGTNTYIGSYYPVTVDALSASATGDFDGTTGSFELDSPIAFVDGSLVESVIPYSALNADTPLVLVGWGRSRYTSEIDNNLDQILESLGSQYVVYIVDASQNEVTETERLGAMLDLQQQKLSALENLKASVPNATQ